MTLLTLMQETTPTFRDVTRLYLDPKYRFSLAEKLDNPAAEDFWATFNRALPRRAGAAAQPGGASDARVLRQPRTLPDACAIRRRWMLLRLFASRKSS